MKIRSIFIALCGMAVCMLPAAPTAHAGDAFGPGGLVRWHRDDGVPSVVRGPDIPTPPDAPDASAKAIGVMRDLAPLFRVRDAEREFRAVKLQQSPAGRRHVRLQQMLDGLPVIGGKLLVHFDENGQAYQVNGRYLPDLHNLRIAAAPMVSAGTAVRTARADLTAMGLADDALLLDGPRLVIYALDGPALKAYELTLAYEPAIRGVWRYYLDANTAAVITRFNQVRRTAEEISGVLLENEGGAEVAVEGSFNHYYRHYRLANPRYYVFNEDTAHIYNDSQSVAWRATPDWGTNTHPDRIQISAAYNIQSCLDYWRDVMGRRSYDGNDARIRVEVLCDIYENNAFWWHGIITFCVVTDPLLNDLAVMDVTGHEFAHGVNESVAGFIYRNEPGALDESYADIFGTALQFHWQPDGRDGYPGKPEPGTASWYVGADAMRDPLPGLRDMRNPANPALEAQHPSRYGGSHWHDYITQPHFDNGGVHINNGVQNFMFYLLADGGQGTNDGAIVYDVTGIGISNAVQLAYQSLYYLHPYATFEDAVTAWISAAGDINTNWVANVRAAWEAVGMDATPPPPVTGPLVKANNQTGNAIVHYPRAVKVDVQLTPEPQHRGTPVDWWVVGLNHTDGQWYFYDDLPGWHVFDGDFTRCRPAHQGPLNDLPATTVWDKILPRGNYTFWFAVTHPMDGMLDVNGALLQNSVTVRVE